jgi:uncharacterized membrane protein
VLPRARRRGAKSHVDGPQARESIVVAARTELFSVTHVDVENLRLAFEAASHREASDLVAVEMVWTPPSEDDRVSTIERGSGRRTARVHLR